MLSELTRRSYSFAFWHFLTMDSVPEKSDIPTSFETDPEQAYSEFVRKCNRLHKLSRELIATTKFLVDDGEVATAARSALLHMTAGSRPSWNVFFKARLSFDVVLHDMFQFHVPNGTCPIEVGVGRITRKREKLVYMMHGFEVQGSG